MSINKVETKRCRYCGCNYNKNSYKSIIYILSKYRLCDHCLENIELYAKGNDIMVYYNPKPILIKCKFDYKTKSLTLLSKEKKYEYEQ